MRVEQRVLSFAAMAVPMAVNNRWLVVDKGVEGGERCCGGRAGCGVARWGDLWEKGFVDWVFVGGERGWMGEVDD